MEILGYLRRSAMIRQHFLNRYSLPAAWPAPVDKAADGSLEVDAKGLQ